VSGARATVFLRFTIRVGPLRPSTEDGVTTLDILIETRGVYTLRECKIAHRDIDDDQSDGEKRPISVNAVDANRENVEDITNVGTTSEPTETPCSTGVPRS